ncbi:hypothetical protein Tco_1361877 [Tanacetum coccineum]
MVQLTKDTLIDSLQITPSQQQQGFFLPPTHDTLSLVKIWASSIELITNYAERSGKNSHQSILSPRKNKKNLAQHTQGKKKPLSIGDPKVEDISNLVPREPKGKSLGCLFRMSSSLMTFEEEITTCLSGESFEASRYLAGDELGIPLTEPGFGDLEADTQRAIEESLKDAHGAPRGPLPPVVFRETNTGKFQPLLEVEGKKEKVRCGQAAQFYSILQTPKKKSPSRIIHLFRDLTNRDSLRSLPALPGLVFSTTLRAKEQQLWRFKSSMKNPQRPKMRRQQHDTEAEINSVPSQPSRQPLLIPPIHHRCLISV